MWRSSPLLFSILGNPLNLHPQSAIAGVTICNIVQRCHADPTFYQFWQALLQCRKVISHGLVDMFIKAVGVLGLTFVPPFQLSWLEFPPTSLLDFTPRGLKALLRRAAAQALFTEALSSSRKDFVAGDSGVLDFDLAPPGPRRIKPWYQRLNAVDESMVLGPMAGALPTADRLYQAGGTSSPNCRFCGKVKEDINHLVKCEAVWNDIGKPARVFEDQPCFATHGILEVPTTLLQAMRQQNPLPELHNTGCMDFQSFWIDGSIYNGDHSFSRTLGLSIINEDGEVTLQWGTRDMWANSFKAELLALWMVLQIHPGPLRVGTDCWSMVKRLQIQPVNDVLAHQDLWRDIVRWAGTGANSRLCLVWIRSHQADSNLNCATWDQLQNHRADVAAKQAAAKFLPLNPQIVASWRTHVHLHRVWLVKLSKRLQILNDSTKGGSSDDIVPASVDSEQLVRQRFVKWDWNEPKVSFGWSMNKAFVPMPKHWKFGEEGWKLGLRFFQTLKWREGSTGISVYELGMLLWMRERAHPPATQKVVMELFSFSLTSYDPFSDLRNSVVLNCGLKTVNGWRDGVSIYRCNTLMAALWVEGLFSKRLKWLPSEIHHYAPSIWQQRCLVESFSFQFTLSDQRTLRSAQNRSMVNNNLFTFMKGPRTKPSQTPLLVAGIPPMYNT